MQAFTAQYQNIHATSMVDADPHRLIQMLYQGLLDRMARAKGHIARNNIEERNNTLRRCQEIVDYLRICLDRNASETLTGNLEALYNYMEEQLFLANTHNDANKLDEVAQLVLTIKEGWDGIPHNERKPARAMH